MTKENQAAIEFAKDKLRCVILQLERDLGIQTALPISMKCLEAMQTCDDLMYNADPLPGEPTVEVIAATPCSNCTALRGQVRELEIRNLGLHRRTHMLQGHNQHFERCESAWCHPDASNDPAMDVGRPEIRPAPPAREEIR